MDERFRIIKRQFENDALIAFIDLLGTQKLYESTLPANAQADKILHVLLGEFDIKFDEHFASAEIKDNFDVSIFADSIVISARRNTKKLIERIVEFLLDYQEDLLMNSSSPSRAILMKDSFFSLKVTDTSAESILGSQYTNISLCGGRGVKFAHDFLKGLPIGTYFTASIEKYLNDEQKQRIVPVRGEELGFIKKKTSITTYVPSGILDEIGKGRDALNDAINGVSEGKNTVIDSLRASFPEEDEFNKWAPWILVHLGIENEILREA